MRGLKVVDSDGDLGIVKSVDVIRSPEPNNPNRTIHITIHWIKKGYKTNFHYNLGWVVVGDNPNMAQRYQPVLNDLYIIPTSRKVTKSWFVRLRELFDI